MEMQGCTQVSKPPGGSERENRLHQQRKRGINKEEEEEKNDWLFGNTNLQNVDPETGVVLILCSCQLTVMFWRYSEVLMIQLHWRRQ